MAYSRYLIAFNGVIFPTHYIKQGTYTVIPNQRTELSANRDNTNYLHRNTSPNHKTKISFETGFLHLAEKTAIQNIMRNGLINEIERKYSMTYWNDETNDYRTAEFYMTDVTYNPLDTVGNDIIYQPVKFDFIQY